MVTKATNSVLNLVDPPIDELVLVTALDVTSGGTGRKVLLDKALLLGNGTDAVAELQIATGSVVVGAQAGIGIATCEPSTPGWALISNGLGVLPGFQEITFDTITGILPVSKGGTSRGAHTLGAILIGNNADAFQEVPTANSNLGYPLISQGDNTAPAYANMNANKIIGTLQVGQGGTGQTGFASGSVVVGGGGGNPLVISTAGAAGIPLISAGIGSIPVFSALPLGTPGTVTGLLPFPFVPVAVIATYTVDSPGYTDLEHRIFNFVVPPDRTYLYGEVVGGGGGGASSHSSNPWSGGGGGGGGYAAGWFGPVTPGATITVTVGKGGRGGATPGLGQWDGEAGGTSSIAGYLTATGGAGGQVTSFVSGGAPGGGSILPENGGIIANGGWGGSGCQSDSATQPGGEGGISFFGGGIYSAQNSAVPNFPNGAVGSGGGGGWGLAESWGSGGMHGYIIIRG